MPAQNLLLTIDNLQFPNFGNDDSKKNFRLLFTIIGNDAKGGPATILSALPPVKEDNWTWKPNKKKAQNFVPNDGKGQIFVDQLTTSERLVLHDVVEILSIDVKVLDVGDKNALSILGQTLDKISGAALDLLVTGAGGMFAKILKSAEGPIQDVAAGIMDVWAKISSADKRLFRGEFRRPDFGSIAPGGFKVEGSGVLKETNDNKGSYSLSFTLN